MDGAERGLSFFLDTPEQQLRANKFEINRRATQHGRPAEALLHALAADVRPSAHRRRNSFVRKKSEMRTVIDAATTVRVVARPTPSAPPVTVIPL